MKKIGLLPRIIIAILLGLLVGQFLPVEGVRLFMTFNAIFSQFLGFLIPFIIIGLVMPAIAEVGSNVGKLLLATVLIAYLDTTLTGLLTYGTGSIFFPSLIESALSDAVIEESTTIEPYFTVNIPAMFDVMSALVLSFIMGLYIAMDSFGTACNVTGDGAIALIVDRLYKKSA